MPAPTADQPAAKALGNTALQGARTVPLDAVVSTSHAALMGRSAKLGQPAVVPPNGTHGRSLHIPGCERPGCERGDGSAAGTRRPGCVGKGLQVQQGASLGIPWDPHGAAIAPLPALQGWALIDLGPALAHVLQRDASGAKFGAAGRAACRPPALALDPGAARRPGWDGSPPLPRTVRSASGLRGQMLHGGGRMAATALVQAAAVVPAGAAGLAPIRNPIMSPDLYPRGPVSTGPVLGALTAELAAGLAELRRLRSALIGSAACPPTAVKSKLPYLPSLQARPGSRTPRDARRIDHECGCAGSERGRNHAGYAPGPPCMRPPRAPRAGSAHPRQPAFGRAALGCLAPPLAAAARPHLRRATCPASVDSKPALLSGPVCADAERCPLGSACGSPIGVARSLRMAVAPAAPALQEQRQCTAAVGGGATGGYAPHYRMQAGPGAGATTCAAAARQHACSRAPAAPCAQPAADAMRHAAPPAVRVNVQAGRGDACEGGCAAAAAPPCSMRCAPSCSSARSGRDPALAGELGGEEQGSSSSAQSSAPSLQGRSSRACGSGGSDSGSRSAAAGGATERLSSSQSGQNAGKVCVAEAREVCCGNDSGDGRLMQLADRSQRTALSVSSAGSVDPGLAGLVCVRLGDVTRRSSDGGRGADVASAAETHGDAAGTPAFESLMEPGGPLVQPAYEDDGPGGGPPSSGANTGLQVPQLAHARSRPAGMQAACSGQLRPLQQAGPKTAVSARGAAARAAPGLPVSCMGQSPGAGAGPELASVLHAGAPPLVLLAAALGAGPRPATHSANACEKITNWLRASMEPDPAAELASAAGSAPAGLRVSEGISETRTSPKSSAVCSEAARIQGALPLPGQSAGSLHTGAACWTVSYLQTASVFQKQCATICSRASSCQCMQKDQVQTTKHHAALTRLRAVAGGDAASISTEVVEESSTFGC